MLVTQLPLADAGREVWRRAILMVGWISFLVATPLLLFAVHLPSWMDDALVVTAFVGGACIVCGELWPALDRLRMTGRR
ncbi:MAG TPA: hypothetical protein VF092_25095 [Longimicrobium sp.]